MENGSAQQPKKRQKKAEKLIQQQQQQQAAQSMHMKLPTLSGQQSNTSGQIRVSGNQLIMQSPQQSAQPNPQNMPQNQQ